MVKLFLVVSKPSRGSPDNAVDGAVQQENGEWGVIPIRRSHGFDFCLSAEPVIRSSEPAAD